MNKYQEALNKMKEDYVHGGNTIEQYWQEEIDLLQELVDKGTAVKPILQSNSDWKCPKCGAYHTKFVQYYCEYCGQKIDWRNIDD